MIEITKQITVDLARKGDTRLIFATQNDQNSRRIRINLTDGGRAYPVSQDVAVIVNIARPDGETGALPAHVMDDGSVLVTLGLWALSVEGELKCSVSIFDGEDKKLTSAAFYIDVQGTLYTGDDIVEDENYSLLANILSEAVKLNGEEKERKEAEQSRQKAESARVAAENVRQTNENNRKAAETSRFSAETARENAEGVRALAEIARSNAENARMSAENSRSNAEKEREAAEEKRDKFVGDIDSALDEIMKVQKDIIDGAIEAVTIAQYPVGSIYLTLNATDPAALFGGTWEKLEGRYLVGTNSELAPGEAIGQASVILTRENLPPETIARVSNMTLTDKTVWSMTADNKTVSKGYNGTDASGVTSRYPGGDAYIELGSNAYKTLSKNNTAFSQEAITIMPPSIAVHMWRRIA